MKEAAVLEVWAHGREAANQRLSDGAAKMYDRFR